MARRHTSNSNENQRTDETTPPTRPGSAAHWYLLYGVLVLLVLVAACVVLQFCASRCRRDVASAYGRSQLRTTRALARSLETALSGVGADLSYLARHLGQSRTDDQAASALEGFLATHHDTLSEICLVDGNGHIQLGIPRSVSPGQVSPEHLHSVRTTDLPYVYRRVDGPSDAYTVEAIAPIYTQGRLVAAVRGRVDVTRRWALCATGDEAPEAQALLVWRDQAGKLRYRPGRPQAGDRTAGPVAAASNWVLGQLQEGIEAAVHLEPTGGQDQILAFAPVRCGGLDCGLVTAAPAAAVISHLQRTQRTLWLVLGSLAITFVGLGLLFSRYQRSLASIEAQLAYAGKIRRSEEALRISQRKLRAQYDSIPIPTYTWRWNGEDFVLEDYNRAAAAITRNNIRRFLGQTASEFFPDHPELARDLRVCLEQQTSLQREHLYRFRSTEEIKPLLVTYGFIPPDTVVVHTADISELYSAHKAIAESERKYRYLFEESVIANAVIDGDLKIIDINRPLAETLGCPRDEIIGQSFLNFVSPEDRPSVGPVLVRAFHGGKTKEMEVKFLGKRAVRVYQLVAGHTADRKDGQAAALLVSGVDITERKRTEEALRESEERFRGLVSNIPGAIYRCRCDPHWTMLFISQTIEEITGYPPGDFLENRARSFNSVIHPDDRETVRDRIIEAINQDQPYIIEYRIMRADGDVGWVHQRGRRVVQNETDILLDGAIFDVTERKLAEQALRESEQRFRMVFEHSSDGISIKELDPKTWRRKLLLCNDRYVEMSGRSREELISNYGRRTLLINRHTPEERAEFRRRLRAGRPAKGIASWLRPDGKPNYHEWTRATIPFGDKLYLFGIDRDITERLQAANALAEAHRQLMAAAETARKHLARELHDSISQGLAALKMSIQATAGEQQANLAERCSQLISEVRRICHGLYPPTLESLGLVSAIQALIEPVKDGPAKLTFRRDPSLAQSRFDDDVEIALFRIAQEAINNALRHSGADRIEVTLGYKEPDLTITVVDNGKGFEPTTALTGLGLRSMRDRAETAGGELRITCTGGRTRVQARIPAKPR